MEFSGLNSKGRFAMDALACWERLCDALSDGDIDEAQSACDDLAKWKARGGFRPVEIPADAWVRLRDAARLLSCVAGYIVHGADAV